MFLKELEKLQKNKKMASFFVDNSTSSKFNVGNIVAFNKEELLIKSISKTGENSGYLYTALENLYKIDLNDEYLAKIELLKKQFYKDEDNFVFDNSEILNSILELSKSEHVLLSVVLYNTKSIDVRGFVKEIQDDHCLFTAIDEYGKPDGEQLAQIVDITDIYFKTKDEKAIEYLYSIQE